VQHNAKKSWDVVVLGGINTDFVVRAERLPTPGQTAEGFAFYSGPGGKGANQAVAAARLGARVALIGSVGTDKRGRELLRGLRANAVNVRHVRLDPKRQSGAAIIAVDRSGEKQISVAMEANLGVTVEQVNRAEKLIAGARVLLMQLEVPMSAVLRAAALAKKYGTKVILDPAPPAPIPDRLFALLDVIRPNRDEAEQITGVRIDTRLDARKAARTLLKKGVAAVPMESGSEGDLLVTSEEEFLTPRFRVKTVDATGAGDAFAGAFAVGLAEGLELGEIARLASATAALATTKLGAQEALPTRKKVERLLRQQRVSRASDS
jgi:ribokinase